MKGVVTYLDVSDANKVRLIMDDVSTKSDKHNDWQREILFTHCDYDWEELKKMQLSQEQFAEIGQNLLLRLCALDGEFK